MPTLLEQALEEPNALPGDARDAIAHDLLAMIRSEREWDRLFADPRSVALFERMAAEAARSREFDFDLATRPGAKAADTCTIGPG